MKGLSLELSLLADGPPLGRLQTLSLGIDGASRRAHCSVQEKITRLLQSGRCPRLRRLWLSDGDPRDDPFRKHDVDPREDAGAAPRRDTGGVAPGDAAAATLAKEVSALPLPSSTCCRCSSWPGLQRDPARKTWTRSSLGSQRVAVCHEIVHFRVRHSLCLVACQIKPASLVRIVANRLLKEHGEPRLDKALTHQGGRGTRSEGARSHCGI